MPPELKREFGDPALVCMPKASMPMMTNLLAFTITRKLVAPSAWLDCGARDRCPCYRMRTTLEILLERWSQERPAGPGDVFDISLSAPPPDYIPVCGETPGALQEQNAMAQLLFGTTSKATALLANKKGAGSFKDL